MSLAVQAQNFTLAGSGCTNSATTIVLKSFKLPDGTTNIVMANFGPTGYGTLEPGTTKEESIKFTGVTQNANGTATLTGVTRGLDFVSPFAETTANKFSHAGGAIFIISNTSAYESELVDSANDQTIAGVKTFTSIPVLPASSPTTDNQATRKKYVDDGLALKMALAGTETVTGQKTFPNADANRARIGSDTDTAVATAFVTLGQLSRQAISGASNASETVKGIVEEATDAEVTAGTATGATGAKLFVTPAKLATRLNTSLIPTDVQRFTTSGANTWTKPANAKSVEVTVIGGGGGGAGGGNNGGGGGGGGAGNNTNTFDASLLSATVTATVGAAGAAGGANASGGDGGDSSFGTYLVSKGGKAGLFASGTAGAGGNSGFMLTGGGVTGAGAGNPGTFGGGGAGGTVGSANVGGAGSIGTTLFAGGGGGGGSGAAGGAGGTNIDGTPGANLPISGNGGAGGNAGAAGNASTTYGGGGGGGGQSGSNTIGAAGGAGFIQVVTYF